MNCPICGKRIVKRNGEYANAKTNKDGIWVHKKCPQPKKITDPAEKEAYRLLRENIVNYVAFHAQGFIAERGINWMNVNVMIKKLKDDGFSYEDQSFALDEVVKMQKGFWGYGAVKNNIEAIILKRDKKAEVQEKVVKADVPKPIVKKWKKKEDKFEW